MIYYKVYPEKPFSHIFNVELEIKNCKNSKQILSLANWISGSYLIRDFAKNIISLTVSSENDNIFVKKIDKNHWCCNSTLNKNLLIKYQIYAFDFSVRTACLTDERAFFNGTSLFLKASGYENDNCEIQIYKPPASQSKGSWKIATNLVEISKSRKFSTFMANNYNDLIDHPVEMSDYKELSFEVFNINHKMVISGEHRANLERIKEDLKLICKHHINFFNKNIPFDKYLFLTLATYNNYGGLEHINSTSLICSREDLEASYIEKENIKYIKFLSLCSHEYFHSWWIKTLKPSVFVELDLNKEIQTEQLWIFEGFTSYYEILSLLRAKIISVEFYLNLFAKNISKVLSFNGYLIQSIADSSFDAWTKFYKQDENAPNAISSYYDKGALVAFMLDIEIRKLTKEKLSLDDVLRYLYANFSNKGLENKDLQNTLDKLCGNSFDDFFKNYVYGVKKISLKDYFKYLGIKFKFGLDKTNLVAFGIRIANKNNKAKITNVFDGGCAQKHGLFVNDLIIAINNKEIFYDNIIQSINKLLPEKVYKFTISRDNLIKKIDIKISFEIFNKCTLNIIKNTNNITKDRQKNWFYGI